MISLLEPVNEVTNEYAKECIYFLCNICYDSILSFNSRENTDLDKEPI